MPIESSYFRERAWRRCKRAEPREVRAIIFVPIEPHVSIERILGLSLAFRGWRKKVRPRTRAQAVPYDSTALRGRTSCRATILAHFNVIKIASVRQIH
jgi:hypothetical protein